MSIIAFDGKTIAADTLSVHYDVKQPAQKLFHHPHKNIAIAFTGHHANGLLMMEWYLEGAKRDNFPSCQSTDNWARLIVFMKEETAHPNGTRTSKIVTSEYEQSPHPLPSRGPWAWGSGRDVALGALEMGADARQAVAVACKYYTTCGITDELGITVVTL
jgi:hypothetical protein